MHQDFQSFSDSETNSICRLRSELEEKISEIEKQKRMLAVKLHDMICEVVESRSNPNNIIINITEERFCDVEDMPMEYCYQWLADNHMFFKHSICIEELTGYHGDTMYNRTLPTLKEEAEYLSRYLSHKIRIAGKT